MDDRRALWPPPNPGRFIRLAQCTRFVLLMTAEEGKRPLIVDPDGGAHDVRRFSTRQAAASKNPEHVADGRFASALKSFLWLLSLRQRK